MSGSKYWVTNKLVAELAYLQLQYCRNWSFSWSYLSDAITPHDSIWSLFQINREVRPTPSGLLLKGLQGHVSIAEAHIGVEGRRTLCQS
ncbi:hypothetical protein BofuT4_uP088260.1 [Botrytis cinerea T4]|uniref:Uncharacterized protein n=1 Tax=Botryotinia fuckeliana (strain T4) TaxID=999810 RepID=G2YG65_BOTF4|nr:hypothetical protein BofuT4_uP088260.1 [Botrytis cinerea T4]